MVKITRINGNNQPYNVGMPDMILLGNFTKHALKHIFENTGLKFKEYGNSHKVKPKNFKQVTALFMTYNFKTEYHDNATTKNTIFLKGMHNVGFKVSSICLDCCKANNIHHEGMNKGVRLSC